MAPDLIQIYSKSKSKIDFHKKNFRPEEDKQAKE
jgi:hypothetical protein